MPKEVKFILALSFSLLISINSYARSLKIKPADAFVSCSFSHKSKFSRTYFMLTQNEKSSQEVKLIFNPYSAKSSAEKETAMSCLSFKEDFEKQLKIQSYSKAYNELKFWKNCWARMTREENKHLENLEKCLKKTKALKK